MLLKNIILKTNKILFKEKFVASCLETVNDAITRIPNYPCRMEEIIPDKNNVFVNILKKDLVHKSYTIEDELKEVLKDFKKCFSAPNVTLLINNLSVLKIKLNIMSKNIRRKKEDTLKTKLVVNILISLGITIIII